MSFIGVGFYVKDSKSAVAAYLDAFGLELGYHVFNKDGSFYHSELCEKNGESMISVVEAPEAFPASCLVQCSYLFETEAELSHAFAILSEGGRVLMDICELPWSPCAADLIDRFGVRWYLTVPQHMPPEDFSPEEN